MRNPLVSILIPVYNAEKYVAEAIESALNQTYKNIEIIIVDDGSTDKSWEIIENYRREYPSIIKSYRQKNKGACAARNKAFKESSGDFIQWLDSDDILAPDKIDKQLKAINYIKTTDILLTGSFTKFYNQPYKMNLQPFIMDRELKPKNYLKIFLKDSTYFVQHCWLVSRDISLKAGEWNESILLNQDGEYFTRVVINSSLIKFVPEAISYYRTGNFSSVSNNKSRKKIVSLMNANLLIVENILKNFPGEELKEACCIFLQKFYSKIFYEDCEIPEIEKLKSRIIELGGIIPRKNYSKKFNLLRRMIGLRTARKLKLFFWYSEVKLRKIIDYFYKIKGRY